MSCQIKGIANLVDPSDVRARLLGNVVHKFEHIPANELPLQNCFVSLSPAGDILAIAWNTHLIILASKWDSRESSELKNKFYVVWDGDVTTEQNEWITSVITLPLISHGKSSAGVDWTCVAVGLNTGFIKFFTETGGLLLEEQLHNESVINIKCQSHCTARYKGDAGTLEDFYVLYNTVVCILPGFSLFSTLRAYRNHLARVKANCNDKSPASNLACKKWTFKNQDFVNDCEVIGSTSVNTFDHLMTASICGGYNASYRSSAPQHNLVMATGKRPFVGFHYALEGGSTPVLSDVAIAMANKVANAIGAAVPWFKNSKNPPTPEKTKSVVTEPPESMTCRFGISDVLREGYRDAQCGWIVAKEEKLRSTLKDHYSKSGSSNCQKRRRALFLAIYAPKKGVIDIWSVQYGTKITTFSASKNGRLLYINYGLCGLNDSAITSSNQAQHPCVFIDPLGEIREITVPFHFALSNQNSNRARDMHLHKKLKKFLREEDFDNEKLINEVTNICLDLKTNEVRFQTIDMLMTNKHVTPDALLSAINCFTKQIELQKEGDLEPETKALNLTLSQLKSVTKFYKYLRSQYDQPPEYNTVASDTVPDGKQLSSILFTSEREITRILKLSKKLENMKNASSKVQTKVKFKEVGRTFLDFLACFEFGSTGFLGLQKDTSHDKICQISKLIFQGWMYSNDPISKWQNYALNSDIKPSVLMQFALHYWLTKKTGAPLEIEMINFTKLLNAICSLTDTEEIYASYNEVSTWWKDVQNILIHSEYPFNALTAAMACRAVSVNIQRNKDRLVASFKDDNGNDKEDDKNGNKSGSMKEDKEKDDNSSPEEETIGNISDWENVSRDACQFSLLIGNLEDISILNAIVSNPPKLDDTTKFYALPYESTPISLGLILSKGKGFVSEIVAKWLSSSGVDPARLIDTTDIEFDQLQLSTDSSKAQSLIEAKAVESIQDTKAVLAVSIEVGTEAKTDQSAVATVLEKVALLKRNFSYSLTSSVLLANLSWEFVMSWSKDIQRLDALEAALTVLRQIPSKRIRHGVCCLLWTLHLKKRMESAGKLINKSGKLPKERLCMQDVGLSDVQLTSFLKHCVTFLDFFLEAEALEDENCSFIKSEELWEGHSNGPLPFALLAVTQSPASYDLIILHFQLASVLHMIAHFNLKVQKPLNNLFDSSINQYFFQDISMNADIPWYQDDRRDNCRVEFLCRVITASMEFIHQETKEVNSLSSDKAVHWMSKCQNLALSWKISSDELRIHQVCQMYVNGFDRIAEEIVMAVNNLEKLAEDLLPIAGGRMMAYLSRSPDMLEEISRISPMLLSYLQCLSSNSQNVVFTNCSNEDTIQLIQKVVRNLPETHNQYRVAQSMLDATFIYEVDEPPQNEN
ncbi:rab3 GTPase-activating protein regulatory subunit isoform X2 [Copidosoma floridanum]|uniref:rab3 GTPase-activating protein regulatory subunit isoform X2 n=1 Tax=Copidosoma floridanum TaxID=29053 RepID=UPI0006C9DFD6|nr:rab3 GTPase-activating protein regulatory subunit isoform X2 [Copidosoma floridanum]